jgi:hypothetical protein
MAPRTDRRPLLAYLKVQEQFEREMLYVLQRSASRIERELRSMERKSGIGAEIRRSQLRSTKAAINREVASLWRLMGSEVNARRAEAAAAAVENMFTYERMLWRSVMDQRDVDTLLRSAKRQAARSVDVVETRMLGYSRIPLSERVYKSQKLLSGQVDRLVDHALARGVSAKELADDVRAFIKPTTPGGVRYAAMRLGRTEINNAFHATQVRQAIRSPAIEGMKWNLSGSHPKPDECNDYADHGGDGVWLPAEVPAKPHPMCLCYMTPVTVPREQFIMDFESGRYDEVIDQMMNEGSMTF